MLVACATPSVERVEVPGEPGVTKVTAAVRAERRLYDGAPPVIPHPPLGAACIACHDRDGLAVPDLGYAPPLPHAETAGLGAASRCQQCHVFQRTDQPWRANAFAGLRQDLRRGRRLYDGAPPVVPHPVFMRESCAACHAGPAAREEIRTTHPERTNCQQCHLERHLVTSFSR